MSDDTPAAAPALPAELWQRLSTATVARIGLARAGDGLATAPLLAFQADHAAARDAVWMPFAPEVVQSLLPSFTPLVVSSAAPDRATYLKRPDLGRRLSDAGRTTVAAHAGGYDVAVVVGDGLSAHAVHSHAAAVIQPLVQHLTGLSVAPLVLVHQARVATADDIAALLGARLVVMLIGERPGLSSADSLGAYVTYQPQPGVTRDADRNCVSNIRPAGLPPDAAAERIAALVRAALQLGLSGVGLKEDTALALTPSRGSERLR
ncbi:MAG: ethanolamine ammonia-lyase subunit EutC [Alphaproteobacteria bacterium]|nr:ethanolamine ammonia-lyase subunit EutC [Alphaproteobacteria bacterium]TAD89919.1 MAG: ethanolamine ammonia-lyase subunit EutC [Alphaproteobacteria bacterium]